jgi:subtilase family serine protease
MGKMLVSSLAIALFALCIFALPDYVPGVSYSPNQQADTPFEMNFTTTNVGNHSANNSSMTLVQYGIGLGPITVMALVPGQVHRATLGFTCHEPLVQFNVTADMYRAVEESSELNNFIGQYFINCSAANMIAEIRLNGSFTNASGTYYIASIITRNIGGVPAGSSQTRALHQPSGINELAWVGPLAPGESAESGPWFPRCSNTVPFMAVADASPVIFEFNETDNSASAPLACPLPDLTITALSAPSLMNIGPFYTGSVATRNNGSAASPATNTRITLGGNLVANLAIPALQVNETRPSNFSIRCWHEGRFPVVATADSADVVVEESENNNVREISVRCQSGVVRANNSQMPLDKVEKPKTTRSEGIFNSLGLGEIDRAVEGFFRWMFGG